MVGIWRRLTNKRKNRWDSSDPERAPPPLPLNPQSPSIGSSRPGTSAAIQSAHAALTEKARESALVSNVLAKRMGEPSTERTPRASLPHSSSSSSSLNATPSRSHRRMQSLQPNPVRDLSLMLESGGASGGRESGNTTPRSPEKSGQPSTPLKNRNDPFIDERPNPGPGPSLTPIIRPIVRRPHQSILGDHTPPQSATMLALHSMATSNSVQRESSPLPALPQPQPAPAARPEPTKPATTESSGNNGANVIRNINSNGSSNASDNKNNMAMAVVKQPSLSVDHLSKQIFSLTSIATALQKEMSALSRRSRDNATDLLSLKEATNARDEDIRKSLRELITNTSEVASIRSRDSYPGGAYLLDNKPHAQPTTVSPLSRSVRPFSLPRIPSPNSFAASLDRESMSTPSLYAADGPNTIAMLERIVREMGTKEGQNMLLNRLSEVLEKLAGMASAAKVEELLQFVQDNQEQAVIPASSAAAAYNGMGGHMGGGGGGGNSGGPGRPRNFSFDEQRPSPLELEYNRRGPMTERAERLLHNVSSADQRRSSAPASGATDAINGDILKIIKTVKDSVAQGGGLTAEVKALVRELRGEVLGMGREIGRRLDEVEVRAKDEGKPASATQAEMAKVVEEGLIEMKQQMNNLMREHRRQSAASTAAVVTAATQAISPIDYQEVYNSMRAALKDTRANEPSGLSRDDVIEAVKDAWETYKPEIEVQQIGLERDEVLACLEEGLRDYAPRNEQPAGATRDEVFKAVVEGLRHFVPPQMPASGMSRDEVLGAVRECLEEFEFPVAASALGAEITKEDMVDAVKQGLNGYDFPRSDRDLIRMDPAENGDEIIRRLQDIMEFMREEFKAVSNEAKENVAANGRDTEQVLDATRDGMEKLRVDLESYVDKVAAAVTHQDFSEGLIRTLDVFRDEISDLIAKATAGSKDMLKDEIESLRDTVNSSLVPVIPAAAAAPLANNREVLEALQEGINLLRGEISSRHVNSTSEVLDAIQEGLADLRISIDKLGNKPPDLAASDEILDALKSGLSDVRTDIGGLRDHNGNAMTTFESNTAMVPADMLRHDDIKNLETLITQLRTKVDIIDASNSQPSSTRDIPSQPEHESSSPGTASFKTKLDDMESKLHDIHTTVSGLSGGQPRTASGAASREDVEAIETILRNTKARLDDLIDGEQFVRKTHIDIIEGLVLETKDSLGNLKSQIENLSSREDINLVESLVAQVANGFDLMKERQEKQLADPERVTKTDVDAIALACLQVKCAVERMAQADDSTGLPSKEDLLSLAVIVRDVRSQLEMESALAANASEDRQAEILGVGDRVSDVKAFLEVLNETIKTRLDDGVLGIESVGKILDSLSDTMNRSSSDLNDLYETMKNEFEESRAGVVGAKLETDERLQQTAETLGAKIDDRIGELITKFGDFQASADDRARASGERDIEVEAAVVGTKTIADELKLLIDTLGSAVTESMEKVEEASKTVFMRVDDMVRKAEQDHSDDKAEHRQTRDQVNVAINAVQGVQGHMGEYQPKILEAIKDVLVVVSEHYEHSKSSTATIQEKIVEAKPVEQQLLPPIEKYDDTMMQEKLDKLVGQTDRAADAYTKLDKMDALVDHTLAVDEALSKLDKLVEHSEDTDKALGQLEKLEKLEKLDKLDYLVAQSDVSIEALTNLEKLAKLDQIIDLSQLAGRAFDLQHAKIDKLIDHTVAAKDAYAKLDTLDKLERLEKLEQLDAIADHSRAADDKADKALSQLETLEKVHQQVMRTAADLAQYMASQTQRITDEHEDRETTLRETLLTLERRQAEMEQADARLAALRDEEQKLKGSVSALKADQESLQRNKIRLTADVSSLETALHIRREELHEMEARAEGLERRILEGVMDHSRVLLMAKANKGREAMSRKRVVPSKKEASGNAPAHGKTAAAAAADNKPRAAFNLAMSAKRSPFPTNSPGGAASAANGGANGSRRILSLNQINSSMSSGSIKRSNSVRANVGVLGASIGSGGLRKSSWGGRLPTKSYGGLEMDKENNAPLKESDEEHEQQSVKASDECEAYHTPRSEKLDAVVAYVRAGADKNSNADDGNDEHHSDSHSEAGTLRRSSMGTSVLTGGETQSEAEDFYSGDEDDDDVMSEWTSSQANSAAPSALGGSEMVLYGSEL